MLSKKIIIFGIILSLLIIGCSSKESRESPLANEATGQIIKETSKPLGNISYEKVKSDTAINAIIDSSQKLDNGNLIVKFHHNSNKEEPVSIIGNVRYELSKATAKPNEIIALTVFGWNDEYFELKVGKQSNIAGFSEIKTLL